MKRLSANLRGERGGGAADTPYNRDDMEGQMGEVERTPSVIITAS